MSKFFAYDGTVLCAAVILASIISFLMTPVVRWAALFTGILDIPRDKRRMHTRAVPLLGGVGIMIAFCVSSLIFAHDTTTFKLIASTVLLGIYGIADDKYALTVTQKLIFQFAAANMAYLLFGGVRTLLLFGGNYPLGIWSYPFTVLWVMLMMNAVNLTDGMDGIAAGTGAISAMSLAIILFLRGQTQLSVCAASLCGAAIGFLFHNVSPAKIFMGETGSAFIGFMLAALSLTCLSSEESEPFLRIAFANILPLTEALSSFLRRAACGKNPFAPDKSHMHHILYSGGLSVPLVAAVLYAFSFACAFAAIIYTSHLGAAVSVFICAFAFVWYMLSITSVRRQ